jgi:hypothetical protein
VNFEKGCDSDALRARSRKRGLIESLAMTLLYNRLPGGHELLPVLIAGSGEIILGGATPHRVAAATTLSPGERAVYLYYGRGS